MIGRRFGRLVVTGRTTNSARRQRRFVCSCDCGGQVVVEGRNLRRGHTRSCGCLQRERTAARNVRHGDFVANKRTTEYMRWAAAKARCFNRRSLRYADYGGRGITMCARWRDSFEAFLEDMGRCPAGLTLDRINNDGNYEPGNCRWATPREQRANQRMKGVA